MRFGYVGGFAMLFAASTATACPVGDYDAIGSNPARPGSAATVYRARATIARTGENVCTIEWDLGGQRFSGVGFFDAARGTLNIAYANIADGWFGQISYEVDGAALVGKWTVFAEGPAQIGTERLTRR